MRKAFQSVNIKIVRIASAVSNRKKIETGVADELYKEREMDHSAGRSPCYTQELLWLPEKQYIQKQRKFPDECQWK